MTEELLKAYRQALYTVEIPSGVMTLRVGERNEALIELLSQENLTDWAYITAENPQSKILSQEENAERNAKLESMLKSKNYCFFNGEGRSVDGSWPVEKSFLVLGILEKEALDLGQKFQQSAILLGGLTGVPILRFI